MLYCLATLSLTEEEDGFYPSLLQITLLFWHPKGFNERGTSSATKSFSAGSDDQRGNSRDRGAPGWDSGCTAKVGGHLFVNSGANLPEFPGNIWAEEYVEVQV